MAEQPHTSVEVEHKLHELAQVVQDADHLDAEARQALATLVEELSKTLHHAPLSTDEVIRLVESTTILTQALRHQHETTRLSQARNRLEEAIFKTEAKAPFLAGIARRVLETLADIGI